MTATPETSTTTGPGTERLARLRDHYSSSDQSAAIEEAQLEQDVDADPMVTTSLRLPRSLLQWVRAEAEHAHVRPTALMRRWLEERHEQAAGGYPDRLAAVEHQVDELSARVERLAEDRSPSSAEWHR